MAGEVRCLSDEIRHLVRPTDRPGVSRTPANAGTGSVGRSASAAGRVARRGGLGRSEAGKRSVAGAFGPRFRGEGGGDWGGAKPNAVGYFRLHRDSDLPQDAATDGIREASRSHAFDSPMPGECRGSRMPANATTGRGGRAASEAGLRSDADEQPGQMNNNQEFLCCRLWEEAAAPELAQGPDRQ
jgi:hypothetical protein